MTLPARDPDARGRQISRHPLERLLSPVEPLPIEDPSMEVRAGTGDGSVRCLAGTGPPQWLTSGQWTLFASAATEPLDTRAAQLEHFVRASGETISATRSPDGTVHVPFSLAEAYENYTAERWAQVSGQRRLSPALLGTFYRVKRLIPRRAQLAARRRLIGWQGLPRFPAWPYDDSAASLLRFAIRCSLVAREREQLRFRWFWPEGAHAAAILTHDVESAEGLRRAVRVADLEEDRGLRSSFNIVADWYDIDWGVVDELHARGFEIGLHGLHHDRSLFSSRSEFERQRPLLHDAALRLGAAGFRSPATHRVDAWIAELPVSYDCTVPLSDPYEPQPGGGCSPWPYFFGQVVELPYTLPQDHTLFTLLRHRTIELWQGQVERLERSFGLVQCLTHPDPGYLGEPANEALYVEFLDFLKERDSLWHALPREVARWWQERDQADQPIAADELGCARLDGGASVVLVPPDC